MMRPELSHEIGRLRALLSEQYQTLITQPPVDAAVVERVETLTGFRFTPDVREFLQFSNGSGGMVWAAACSSQLIPLQFLPLEDALEVWDVHWPFENSAWRERGRVWDPRVQPELLVHRRWFPLACFGLSSALLLYDGDPTPLGRDGQIILYEQDPEGITYVADGFLEFFRKSNDLLTVRGQEVLMWNRGEAVDAGETDEE